MWARIKKNVPKTYIQLGNLVDMSNFKMSEKEGGKFDSNIKLLIIVSYLDNVLSRMLQKRFFCAIAEDNWSTVSISRVRKNIIIYVQVSIIHCKRIFRTRISSHFDVPSLDLNVPVIGISLFPYRNSLTTVTACR